MGMEKTRSAALLVRGQLAGGRLSLSCSGALLSPRISPAPCPPPAPESHAEGGLDLSPAWRQLWNLEGSPLHPPAVQCQLSCHFIEVGTGAVLHVPASHGVCDGLWGSDTQQAMGQVLRSSAKSLGLQSSLPLDIHGHHQLSLCKKNSTGWRTKLH